MFLVELVMQGVRGFQQLARLRFQGGFNLIAAGNEAGKTTSVDAVQRLLFPSLQPGCMETLVSHAVPDGSRGALVVYGDDGSYYRVIQDFSKKAVNLSQYNAATKEFALLHKDWDSAAGFMAGQLPGLTEEDFARVFIFRHDACAGSPPAPASLPAAASAPKARPAAAPAKAAAQEARLGELRETLRKAEEAADAEYKLDAAKIGVGELAKKFESIEEDKTRMAELDAQIEELRSCADLPENIDELISAHEEQASQKAAKSDDLQRDIEALKMQAGSIPAANLLTEKFFLAGVALGLIAVIAGLFVLEAEQAIFFPLGMLGALLLIAAGWYNSTRKNAQRKVVQKDIDELEKELAAMEKAFQNGGAEILRHLKATNSSTTAELKEKADNYRYFLSLRQDLDEQLRLRLGGGGPEDLQAEYARAQEEAAQCEQRARSLAPFAMDTYSVRQEIERIESDMGAGAQDFGGFSGAEPPAAAAGIPAQAPSGDINMLADIALAARLSGIEMETLVPAVEAAGQRNLAAASAGKYVRIEVGHDGQPVVHDKANARAAFAELSHGTRAMVYFCLRAGLVEAIAGKRRLPFLLDDPFTGLDFGRQQAACQILRSLGSKTQVIVFTSNSALRMPTDAAAELK